MSLRLDPNRKKLRGILETRSQEVLKRFSLVATSSFSYPELTSILHSVDTRWREITRPALISLSCEAVGGQPSITDDASLMITLIAAGMAVHDDIVDQSKDKHLRETILGSYGLSKTLLVGDLLIIKGLTTARNFLESAYSAEKKRALFEVLQNFLFEIYEGELMDNACVERIDTELEDYTKIMWKLTADIEACTRMGAILGGGSENEIQALAEFGRRLCFVTKLGDELKDSLNREGSLSHRLKYESVPLPILYAAKSSKDAFLEIESILKRKAVTPDRIRRICWKTHAVTYVYNMAKQNATEATQKLQSLSPSTARDVLTLMLKVSLTYIRRECNLEKRYVECASS